MHLSSEIHPFGDFVPHKSKYLVLGSFPAREGGDWFYGSKRNQFWQILESVYGVGLKTKKKKQRLLSELGVAVADIILKCDRKNGSSLDFNLTNIVYNIRGIEQILKKHKIQKIFFTSRFVEKKFRGQFKEVVGKFADIELVTLPSPSPRYAAVTKAEKIKRYKETLPIRQLLKS